MQKKALYIFIFLTLTSFTTTMQSEEKEYSLKAAFIYNFTKYIEWNGAENPEFVVGVLGNSAIYGPLSEIARTQTVNNRKIVLRQYSNINEIGNCNILFISNNVTTPIKAIKQKISKEKTLTVSEKSEHAAQGTAFNFIIINNKVKFEANMRALNETSLKVSSQLLKLAIIRE